MGKIENGVPGQIRTADTRIRNPVLYPSELQGHIKILTGTYVLSHLPALQRTCPPLPLPWEEDWYQSCPEKC